MPSMDTLVWWIMQLIYSERHGGRTLCTDENTVVLYDCWCGRTRTRSWCITSFQSARS